MKLTVPGNPIPLARPRVTGRNVFTPEACARYKHTVAAYARGAGMKPLAGPVRVNVRFLRASEQACDLDNLVKAVLDGLLGIAFADDRQVVSLAALKGVDRRNPRTELEVEAIVAMPDAEGADEREAIAAQTPADFARVLGPKPLEKLRTQRLVSSVRRFA
jgi:Holliday junction resolvase RusA-like endonuclease